MKKLIPAAMMLYVFLAVAVVSPADKEDAIELAIKDGENTISKISVEVADSRNEIKKGLMHRKKISTDGMIFIFGREKLRSFWMKNTYIPLDMVFVYENKTINKIMKAYPEPNTSDDQLKRYRAKAKYVIELKQNYTDKEDIEEGDRISLPASMAGSD